MIRSDARIEFPLAESARVATSLHSAALKRKYVIQWSFVARRIRPCVLPWISSPWRLVSRSNNIPDAWQNLPADSASRPRRSCARRVDAGMVRARPGYRSELRPRPGRADRSPGVGVSFDADGVLAHTTATGASVPRLAAGTADCARQEEGERGNVGTGRRPAVGWHSGDIRRPGLGGPSLRRSLPGPPRGRAAEDEEMPARLPNRSAQAAGCPAAARRISARPVRPRRPPAGASRSFAWRPSPARCRA